MAWFTIKEIAIKNILSLICFSLLVVFILSVPQGMASMSMVGTTGLVCIPTAQVIPDGKVAFGVAYTDAKYSYRGPESAQIAYYATVGYLPFLEVSLRLSQFPDYLELKTNYGSAKDRMASAKLRIMKENRYFPSIVLGIHDIYGDAVKFNAQYIVASKSINFPLLGLMYIHTGYAPNPIKFKKIMHYSMEGAFAGIEKVLCPYLTATLEYDSRKFNIGLKIVPLGDRVYINIAVLGMNRISGGVSFSADL
jgi:hypothetical protein